MPTASRVVHAACENEIRQQHVFRDTVRLVALHDIGKFAEGFQCKSEAAWPADILGPYDPIGGVARHDQLGFDLRELIGLQEALRPAFESRWREHNVARLWVQSLAGHHGRPVREAMPPSDIHGLRGHGLAAAKSFARAIANQFGPFEPLRTPDRRDLALASWMIAGLVILLDWVGSSRRHFPYREPSLSIAEYWIEFRARADAVLRENGLKGSPPSVLRAPAELFTFLTPTSPLQAALWGMPLGDGPMLAIVEDVTGSGKTEAAPLFERICSIAPSGIAATSQS